MSLIRAENLAKIYRSDDVEVPAVKGVDSPSRLLPSSVRRKPERSNAAEPIVEISWYEATPATLPGRR